MKIQDTGQTESKLTCVVKIYRFHKNLSNSSVNKLTTHVTLDAVCPVCTKIWAWASTTEDPHGRNWNWKNSFWTGTILHDLNRWGALAWVSKSGFHKSAITAIVRIRRFSIFTSCTIDHLLTLVFNLARIGQSGFFQPWKLTCGEIYSCLSCFIARAPSSAAVAAKAQQDPHCAWFRTGITAFRSRQSKLCGMTGTSECVFSGTQSKWGQLTFRFGLQELKFNWQAR